MLQLSDELNLNLARKIRDATKAAVEAEGGVFEDRASFAVVDRMLDAGRGGKLAGAGYYDYEDGKRTGLWKGLKEMFPETDDPASIPLKDLEERMLFAEALETVKCLDEGVIESVADANIGSILGIGFPGWTGGVLQYINGYEAADVPPASSPARASSRPRTASASSRPRRWSRRPSAARRTAAPRPCSRAPDGRGLAPYSASQPGSSRARERSTGAAETSGR